jgi:D-arabinose 1-dehydrogenase-like Zn-dependent alcohol dehydrogenase
MQYPTEPGALGHEAWGFVDALGEGVDGVSVGDRVAALSYKSYAEYDLADAEAVVRLPEALAGQPFPGEPLGCAMNILRRCEIEPGQTVAVIGIGFLGAILTKLAADAGARVIAITRRPFSLLLKKSAHGSFLRLRARSMVIPKCILKRNITGAMSIPRDRELATTRGSAPPRH